VVISRWQGSTSAAVRRPEARATVAAELAPVFKADRRDYVKSNYSAVAIAEAVRQLLPKGEVTAVMGTGVRPSSTTRSPHPPAPAPPVGS
jgi:hypothetical protein